MILNKGQLKLLLRNLLDPHRGYVALRISSLVSARRQPSTFLPNELPGASSTFACAMMPDMMLVKSPKRWMEAGLRSGCL